MVDVYSQALRKTSRTERLIAHLQGKNDGPTVVFFGGVHGNEPAGVLALQHVFRELEEDLSSLCGQAFAIAGNLEALGASRRFIDRDLNRIWEPEFLSALQGQEIGQVAETKEVIALLKLLEEIQKRASPPFYFIDLHTTSSSTTPFIVMNDSSLNRRFCRSFELPVILGIEEYLQGALLSHINDLGYVSFGFESGQHQELSAITLAEYFVGLCLFRTGVIPHKKKEAQHWSDRLLQESLGRVPRFGKDSRFYEIYYQHLITPEDRFEMCPGFSNFQIVPQGTILAHSRVGTVQAHNESQLFMPLYQKQGAEGYYFIRNIPGVFLWIGGWFRRLPWNHILVVLPGIQRDQQQSDCLRINKAVVRSWAKPIFHLMGFRVRSVSKTHWLIRSRDLAEKRNDYRRAPGIEAHKKIPTYGSGFFLRRKVLLEVRHLEGDRNTVIHSCRFSSLHSRFHLGKFADDSNRFFFQNLIRSTLSNPGNFTLIINHEGDKHSSSQAHFQGGGRIDKVVLYMLLNHLIKAGSSFVFAIQSLTTGKNRGILNHSEGYNFFFYFFSDSNVIQGHNGIFNLHVLTTFGAHDDRFFDFFKVFRNFDDRGGLRGWRRRRGTKAFGHGDFFVHGVIDIDDLGKVLIFFVRFQLKESPGCKHHNRQADDKVQAAVSI